MIPNADYAKILKLAVEVQHEWIWDWPWHMVDLRDWFYMVNTGYIAPVYFLHVRVFGLRSLWKLKFNPLTP